jgi:CRISPR-associated endonuclease Cas2
MKPENTFYVVMYDITHSATLQKVGKLLVKAGFERINYSVWLGWADPVRQPLLKDELVKLLQRSVAKGSVFYILPVSKKEVKRMRGINGRKPRELDYWMGERRTMFI